MYVCVWGKGEDLAAMLIKCDIDRVFNGIYLQIEFMLSEN